MSPDFGKTAPEIFANPDEYVMEYQLESERGFHLLGTSRFSSNMRLPRDPTHYTSVNGEPLGQRLMDFEVPDDSWVWMWPQWHVDMTADVDDQGWCYAWRFHSKKWAGRHRFLRSFVRQRVWRRPRIKRHCLKPESDVPPPSKAGTPTVPTTNATDDAENDNASESNTNNGDSRVENRVRSVSETDAANLNSSDVLKKEHRQQERKERAKSIAESQASSEEKASARILEHIRSFRNDRERVVAIVDYIGEHPEEHEVLVSMRDSIMAQLTFNVSKRSLVTKLSNSTNENCQLFLRAPSNSWRDIVLQRGEPEREPLNESEDAN